MPVTLLRSLTRKGSFLGASALGLGSAVVGRGTVFGINIALAHMLTIHDYGIFSYAYGTALNLGMFLAAGASQAAGHVLPGIPAGPARSRQLLAFLLVIVLLAAIAAVLLLGVSESVSQATFGSSDGTRALQVASALLFFSVVVQGGQGLLYAVHEHRPAAVVAIGVAILTLGLMWLLPPVSNPVAAMMMFAGASVAGSACQIAVVLRRCLIGVQVSALRFVEFRRTVSTMVPATLTTLLGAPVHWLCLSTLAGATNGVQELALFSVAFQWYVVITFIPAAVGSLALPFLSKRHDTDHRQGGLRYLRWTFALAGGTALFLGAATFLFADELIRMFYPGTYDQAAASVRALACAATLCGISVVLQQQIASRGRFWLNVWLTLAYSAIYFGGTALLVRLGYGARSLGLSMTTAYIALLVLQTITVYRDMRVKRSACAYASGAQNTGVHAP